jgi:hypothetical protein
MRFALVAALVAFLGLPLAPSAQSDLNGTWSMIFNGPQGAIDSTANFKVDGDKLSGTLSGPAGEIPLTGSVKGKAFTFNVNVQTGNGDFSVTVSGEQDGDSIKGTFDFGQGTGDWSGTRK